LLVGIGVVSTSSRSRRDRCRREAVRILDAAGAHRCLPPMPGLPPVPGPHHPDRHRCLTAPPGPPLPEPPRAHRHPRSDRRTVTVPTAERRIGRHEVWIVVARPIREGTVVAGRPLRCRASHRPGRRHCRTPLRTTTAGDHHCRFHEQPPVPPPNGVNRRCRSCDEEHVTEVASRTRRSPTRRHRRRSGCRAADRSSCHRPGRPSRDRG